MNIIKRITSTCLSLLLLLSMVIGHASTALADDEGTTPGAQPLERTEVTITNFSMTSGTGETVNTTSQWAQYNINLTWDASVYGNELHAGDYFNVILPDNMNFPVVSAASHFGIYDESGTMVATGDVTSKVGGGGSVRVTFTEYVENRANIHGTISLASTFVQDKITLNSENSFSVTVNGQVSTFTVPVMGPNIVNTKEILSKWSVTANSETEAIWVARINFAKGELHNVTITDSLSSDNGLDGMHYIEGSFELLEIVHNEYGEPAEIVSRKDVSDRVVFNEDKTSYSLNLGNLSYKSYRLTYKTTYSPGKKLTNTMTLTASEDTSSASSYFMGASSSGTGQGDLLSKIKIVKVDKENQDIRLSNAKFTLKSVSNPKKTYEVVTDENGEAITEKLTPGDYVIEETEAPVGYDKDSNTYTVTVVADDSTEQIVTNAKQKTSVDVKKTWSGKKGESAVIHLFADGQEIDSVELNKENNWKHTFKGLDLYSGENLVEYTVQEDALPGYTTTIKGNAKDGFEIINEEKPTEVLTLIPVSVEKKWVGDKKESATVRLYADGQEIDSVVLSAENNWSFVFDGLDDSKTYTVKEDAIQGYESKVTGNVKDGFVITNTQQETISIPVQKQWVGKATDRVVIHLFQNGNEIDSVTLDADSDWKHTFTDLDPNAEYSIREDAVEGYTSQVSGSAAQGFVITNTQESPVALKVDIPVEKKWVGTPGSSATIRLMANGQKVAEVTLNDKNNWKHTFTDLDVYSSDGKAIVYTVEEAIIPGYQVSISKKNGGFVVTNTKTSWIPTGLNNHTMLYGVGVIGALGIVALVLKKRKHWS